MPYDLLEKMYHQNPWWEKEDLIQEDYHVHQLLKTKAVFLNESFLKHPFKDGVYIVTGPRQIGKTTHLKLLIQRGITEKNRTNFLYFNCDILDTKKEIVELVETYLRTYPSRGRKFILLDEITAVPDSILAIKYLIDAGKNEKITYILTGSSTVNIKKTGEFLPGRRGKGKNFVFLPMSFADFIHVRYPDQETQWDQKESLEKFYIKINGKIPLHKELERYLMCGGIPRIINDYLGDGKIDLDNFLLYRDWIISEISKNGKREAIVKIILERILMSIGSEVSYNAFVADSAIGSHNTIYDYLNFLEDAFVIRQIYHYNYHQKKIHFRKNKKIYLRDPFLFWLVNWWLGGDPHAYRTNLKENIFISRMMENVVFLHLESLFGDMYFYRDGREIDFIYRHCAFECKYQQQKIAAPDIKELLKFSGKRFVITKEEYKKGEGYQAIPVALFLLLEKKYFET